MRKIKGSVWTARDALRFYSIEDYGARVTRADNSSQINACVTAALAADRAVYIPAGVYKTTPLAINTTALGAKKLKVFGDGTLKLVQAVVADTPLLTITTKTTDYISLVGFKLDGDSLLGSTSVGPHGISTSTYNLEILGVDIFNTGGSGIEITSTNVRNNILIDSCRIINPKTNGMLLTNVNGMRVSNVFVDIQSPGALLGAGVRCTSSTFDCKNIQFNNVAIAGATTYGFHIEAGLTGTVTDLVFNGCASYSSALSGFYIGKGERIVVSGGIFVDSTSQDGVRLAGASFDNRILGADARGNLGFGIQEVTAGGTPDRNKYIGCISVGNTGSNVITVLGPNSTVIGS